MTVDRWNARFASSMPWMKGPLSFLAVLAVIIIGLGVWMTTPQGGGGIGEDGPAGGAGGVATPATVNDDASDRSEGSVDIVGGAFKPSTVEVIGQPQVTFINRDDVAHGIDFEDKKVKDRKRIAPGEAYVAELPGEGRFKFTDPTDKKMKGTAVVTGG